MGTMDDLLIKAKELARAAGDKTEEVVGYTRLKLQMSQLKSDIEENYEKLGQIVYELHCADTQNQELLDMCFAELDAQNEQLEELQFKIDQLKNTVKCPACKQPVPNQAKFCSNCGSPVNPEKDSNDPPNAAADTATVVPAAETQQEPLSQPVAEPATAENSEVDVDKE